VYVFSNGRNLPPNFYVKEQPVIYGISSISKSEASKKFDIQSGNMFTNTNDESFAVDKGNNTAVAFFEHKISDSYELHQDGGFFQIHLYPEQAYYPRNINDGKPILEQNKVPTGFPFKMDFATAQKYRVDALDTSRIENLNYRIYRNPYYSDSASTVVSFAFMDDGSNTDIFYGSSDLYKDVNPEVNFNYFPQRAIRINSLREEDVKTALLRCFATSSKADSLCRTAYYRCPGWEQIDSRNGQYVFNTNPNGSYTRNHAVSLNIWQYNNCPCTKVQEMGNLTVSQFKNFPYLTLPTCSMNEMQRASKYLGIMQKYLVGEDLRLAISKQSMVHQIEANRTQYLLDVKNKNPTADIQTLLQEQESLCGQSWLDQLP
jgi:hypothetical protein